MQDMYNLKIFEVQRINEGIMSCRRDMESILSETEKEKLNKKIQKLEKEKLNDELIESEDLSELIKIKYALLLSNYAVYQGNKLPNPKRREVKTLMQRLLDFDFIRPS